MKQRSTFILRPAVFAAILMLAVPSAGAFAAALEVFSMDPSFIRFNQAGQTVRIRGVGFTLSTIVRFDAVTASITFVDSRTLIATVPTVASARRSIVTLTDTAAGTDDFQPFFYVGPIIHVATTGDDHNNGSSPVAPKRTIADAFAAADGNTPTEIRVAGGEYIENNLALPDNGVLACGWSPGFVLRSPDLNVTDINGNGAGFVMRSTGLQSFSTVDGCTLRNGFRDGFGGGGLNVTADTMVINNNVIVGNTSSTMGGGMYFTVATSYGERPTISNNVLIGNRSFQRHGGGIAFYPSYNIQYAIRVNISGNAIVGNRSVNSYGGGVSLATGSYAGYNVIKFNVSDNIIAHNRSHAGGGFDITIQNSGDEMDLSFDNNLIFGNRANGGGGGLSISGFGVLTGRVSSSTISENQAGPGQGGGFVIPSSITLTPEFAARDLILWGNPGGDALFQALTRVKRSNSGTPLFDPSNISSNPFFTVGPLGRFYLRQNDPNAATSPSVNAGSDSSAGLSLDALTTGVDHLVDSGVADHGFHYPAAIPSTAAPLSFSRIDPARGDFNGNDWVLIRGDGIQPGAEVTFDGVPSLELAYLGPTRILAQPRPHARTLVSVRITNPDFSFVQVDDAYEYVDNEPPGWISTVGLVSAQTGVDCVRSVLLDWNPATDATSMPITYDVYREECTPPPNDDRPCGNFGFFPSAANFIGSTKESTFLDLNHPGGGGDPKYVYNLRGRDSATPAVNRELNFSKRVSFASSLPTDTIPPNPVGVTLSVSNSTDMLDWEGAPGAVKYGVYRETTASAYGSPGTLVKLIVLDPANNDLNGDLVTDSEFFDPTVPALGQAFFYRLTAIDTCNVETISELGL